MDEIVDGIGKIAEIQNSGVFVVEPHQMWNYGNLKDILPKIIKGTGIKFGSEVGETFATVSTITVTGKEIVITQPEMLADILSYLGGQVNPSIDPNANGTVEFSFTFYNTAVKIADGIIPVDVSE
jgi:hypothetical protein